MEKENEMTQKANRLINELEAMHDSVWFKVLQVVMDESILDSGYRIFVEVEHNENWLDPEKDGFNVPYECKPPEDEDFEDDDWTALKERPFEGRPGTNQDWEDQYL